MNEEIKKAITKNRGGLETATDSQLKQIWDSLTIETQKQYLQTIKKDRENADTIGTKSGI